jgi:predicted lipoprotein with Yx(FWY)xxD motif
MRFTSRSIAVAAGSLGLFGLLGLAACGDDDDDSTANTSAADTTAPDDESAPAESASTVATADTDLGTILVDDEGITLYLFMPDAQGASTCVDTCAATWPALAGPATAGDGVDEGLLGTADRPDDGSTQATYNGWPLYHFANDTAPGDTNGQGIGNVWFVVAADGNPVSS